MALENSDIPRMALMSKIQQLPNEIIYEIIRQLTGPQRLNVTFSPHFQDESQNSISIEYQCETDKHVESGLILPIKLQGHYWCFRRLSWLNDTKVFSDPIDFGMSHHHLSLSSHTKLPSFHPAPKDFSLLYEKCQVNIQPLLRMPHQHTHHGLEHIILDFHAAQYFAFFKVAVPPFSTQDKPVFHGTASLLQHTKSLTLHFGSSYNYSNAWFDVVQSPLWEDSRWRSKVCHKGIIIDWILEYAWANSFIQHIPKIHFTGDVQAWVKEKWYSIFERQIAHDKTQPKADELDPFAVYRPDLRAIESYGMDSMDMEEMWRPEDHYPPSCICQITCERLQDGVVLDEMTVSDRPWEEDASPTVPVGDWYIE